MPHTLSLQYQARSQNARIRYLVIHYTAVDLATSLQLLTKGDVSAHYLIPDDITNPGLVYQLVAESQRAWHAGVSSWQGTQALNDTSIGIELVHPGFTEIAGKKIWAPFSPTQIETLISLIKEIQSRHAIHPTCIVGHSDIAPTRKQDPGPLFPWHQLFLAGIGAWPDANTVKQLTVYFEQHPAEPAWLQHQLQRYGYAVEVTGCWEEESRLVLQAFQQHFRPSLIDGNSDAETCAILVSLLARYGMDDDCSELLLKFGTADHTPATLAPPPPTSK